MAATPFLLADAGCTILLGVVGEDIATTTFTELPKCFAFPPAPNQQNTVDVSSFETPLSQRDEITGRVQNSSTTISFYRLIGNEVQNRLIANEGSTIGVRLETEDAAGNTEVLTSLYEIGSNDLLGANLDDARSVTVNLAKVGPTTRTETMA